MLRTADRETFPWGKAPTYIVRDNDRAFGNVFTRDIQAMGIGDRTSRRRHRDWRDPKVRAR